MRLPLIALATVAALAGVAEAYPQFQLSRDKTCTGCHVSPAGGGLLTENGESTAEGISTLDHSAAFFYGKVTLPKWLILGGDLRGATGYIQTPEKVLASFPMQLEVYADAQLPSHLSIHVTAGSRPAREGNEGATRFGSREHYLMWRTDPGAATGMFLRAGRFMPVFGLRFAEHPLYTRRFGGTPLYGETYGVAVERIWDQLEVHLTGFVPDPLIETVRHSSGGALYAELRPAANVSIGGGGMLEVSDEDKKLRGTVTGKYYLAGPDLLLQAEMQVMNQRVDGGGAPVQLIGNLIASRPLGRGLLLDLGIGHFDSNVRVRDLDRDCLDVNLHWFASSHIEMVFNGRYEVLAFGRSGDPAAYALLQAHYRL
jgi:hypothetical protein